MHGSINCGRIYAMFLEGGYFSSTRIGFILRTWAREIEKGIKLLPMSGCSEV